MRRYTMSKQAGQIWIVISSGRLLPASLRQPLALKQPVPLPAPFCQRQRLYSPTRMSLIPLSRRPVLRERWSPVLYRLNSTGFS